MNSLNDSSVWKSFHVSDIFYTEIKNGKLQTPTGAWMAQKDLIEGDIPRITVSGFNNGVTGYYGQSDNQDYRVFENFISVSFLGTIFYQSGKASLDMKVHCLKPLDIQLTENTGLFLVSVIRKEVANFVYADQLSSTLLPLLEIHLPATKEGKPDWAFMEVYMRKALTSARVNLECLGRTEGSRHCVDTHNWKEFSIGGKDGLFHIEKGTRLTRANMREGMIPFIGASTANNGITGYVGNTGNIHPGNVITVAYNGQKATGKAFYQPNPFWASDDVHVLYPNFELNELRALFLLPIFRIVGKPYAFEDKWKIEYMEKDRLPLPVDDSGMPDWTYMESYMSEVLRKSEEGLKNLTQAIR